MVDTVDGPTEAAPTPLKARYVFGASCSTSVGSWPPWSHSPRESPATPMPKPVRLLRKGDARRGQDETGGTGPRDNRRRIRARSYLGGKIRARAVGDERERVVTRDVDGPCQWLEIDHEPRLATRGACAESLRGGTVAISGSAETYSCGRTLR